MNNDPNTNVWVLTDDRAGNRTQAVGIADALGASYELKNLSFGPLSRLHNIVLGASVLGLNRRGRRTIAPPWPRLVIAAGRRTAPVARWIKRQSGRRTQIVQLGRKGSQDPRPFDAVVTPAHANLPAHPKRIETLGPLNRVSDEALAAAASTGSDPFQGGPKPHVALLVGGATAGHRFGTAEAMRLGVDVVNAVREAGGTLVAVTSRRTGEAATGALAGVIGDGGTVSAWRSDDPDNTYLTCLARADVILVTGDSESMIAEAAATGKAVYICAMPQMPKGHRLQLGVKAVKSAAAYRAGCPGLAPRFNAFMIDSGLLRPPRDLALMHSGLESMEYVKIFTGKISDHPPAAKFREAEHVAETLRAMLRLDWL